MELFSAFLGSVIHRYSKLQDGGGGAISARRLCCPEAVDMNGRFQMQGGKNWFLPKEMNANRFFWDSHWLEIWSNHFYPSMGPNGGSVAMDSESCSICNSQSYVEFSIYSN
jgi:hypothetical protein